MTALSMTCPHCGSPNEFFVIEVDNASAVNCSSCGQTIGPWGDMVTRAEETAESTTPEQKFIGWTGEETTKPPS